LELCEGTCSEGSFAGNSKNYLRHVNRGFGNGVSLSLSLSLSPYRGSVRATWWEGSYTEDSERYVMKDIGNRAFLL